MWKNDKDRLLAMAIAIAFHSEEDPLKEDLPIRGTININNDDHLISVCVLGTGEHIPVKVDKGTHIKLNDRIVEANELPIGVFIEADLEESADGRSKIKNIVTDLNKTVFNFYEINKGEERNLIKVLESTSGIYNFEIDNSSLQIYIEYDHEFLSYKSIEKVILEEGLKLEQ